MTNISSNDPITHGEKLARAAATADAEHEQASKSAGLDKKEVPPGHPFPSVDGPEYSAAWDAQQIAGPAWDQWWERYGRHLGDEGLRILRLRYPSGGE